MHPNQSRIETTSFISGDELSFHTSSLDQLAESARLSIDTKVEQDANEIARQKIAIYTIQIDTARKEKAAA